MHVTRLCIIMQCFYATLLCCWRSVSVTLPAQRTFSSFNFASRHAFLKVAAVGRNTTNENLINPAHPSSSQLPADRLAQVANITEGTTMRLMETGERLGDGQNFWCNRPIRRRRTALAGIWPPKSVRRHFFCFDACLSSPILRVQYM